MPPVLYDRVHAIADEQGVSLNQAVVLLLASATGGFQFDEGEETREMEASRRNVFLMSCGSPEYRFPDDWMTTEERSNDSITDSHINKWWSSGCPHQVQSGDVAVLVATGSGKVMGAFAVVGDPVEDRSHPRDPAKWSWTVPLRPLVLLDGTLAPVLRDFGLKAPHKYRSVDADVAARLLNAIHPSL
jgi:hypothetical protein